MPSNPENGPSISTNTSESSFIPHSTRERGEMTLQAKAEAEARERAEAKIAENNRRLEEYQEALKAMEAGDNSKAEELLRAQLRARLEAEAKGSLLNGASQDPTLAPAQNLTPVSQPTPNQAPTSPEVPNRSEIINKAKKNSRLKSVVKTATAIVLAAIVFTGAYLVTQGEGNKKIKMSSTSVEHFADSIDDDKEDAIIEPEKDDDNFADADKNIEPDPEILGIKDGYNEPGMWLDQGKPGKGYAFANAVEVAKICNNDPKEMIKYTANNQVESMSDYIALMPDGVKPEGFKGLSLREVNYKLENLTPEQFDEVRAQFNKAIDEATVGTERISGKYHNAFMSYMAYTTKDGRTVGANDDYFKQAGISVTHDNMNLVYCQTNEESKTVTKMSWQWVDQTTGETKTSSMLVKIIPVYDDNGVIVGYEGCIQAISENNEAYEGLEEVSKEPDPITPIPEIDYHDHDEVTPKPNKPTPEITPDPPTVTPDPTVTPPPEVTPDPTVTPPPEVTPDPTVTPKPKDAENLVRIDEEAHEEIAEQVHSNEVTTAPVPSEVVEKEQPRTEKPTSENTVFEGNTDYSNVIVPNNIAHPEPIINVEEPSTPPATNNEVTATPTAEPTPVVVNTENLSPENNYSENLGRDTSQNPVEGAESQPPAPEEAVQATPESTIEANANEITDEEARAQAEDLSDDMALFEQLRQQDNN